MYIHIHECVCVFFSVREKETGKHVLFLPAVVTTLADSCLLSSPCLCACFISGLLKDKPSSNI